LIIYNESDYLEAHLTEISSESHHVISIDAVPQLLTDALKRFTSPDSDPHSSAKSRPSKPRKG